jgi:Sec-independent protein translocase protein TatA
MFGAKRLPEIGASMGRGIREFKRSLGGVGDAFADGLDLPERRDLSRDAPGSPPFGEHAAGEPRQLVG